MIIRILQAGRDRGRVRRRRGLLLMVELLFTLPILLMFLFVILQIYLVVTAREEMLAASRLGARVAAAGDYAQKAQVTEEVNQTVRRALGRGRLTPTTIKVVWSRDLPPEEVVGEADWVQVRLEIPVRRVSPDLMGWLGMTFGGQQLLVATTMKEE